MKITFELQEIHRLIISAVYLSGLKRLEDLGVAIRLVLDTEGGDYHRLLGKILKDRVYRLREYDYDNAHYLGRIVVCPIDSEELTKAVNALEALGLLTIARVVEGKAVYTGTALTEEGVRVAEAVVQGRTPILRPLAPARTLIFVASAFGNEQLDALFYSELKPACERLKLTPFRIDLSEPEQAISDGILKAVLASKCVVADLTLSRPSVYFEVGFAHGLGIPILLTCREDHYRSLDDKNRVHFDLEQYKISFWRQDAQGNFCWSKSMSPTERLSVILQEAPRTGLKWASNWRGRRT